MKKLFVLLLCMVMVISMFAACRGGDNTTASTNGGGENTVPSQTDPTESTAPLLESPYPKDLAAAEEITFEPLYYLSFEDNTNLTPVVQQAHNDADGDGICDTCTLTGATYEIVPSDNKILHTNGVSGSCIYLDGSYGVKLENLVETADDSYTISFWVNVQTMANYMPSLQIGRNVGMEGVNEACTWINVTQTDFFSAGGSFPCIWNRNSSIDLDGDPTTLEGVWPWLNKLDDTVYGKKEWIMVTIVATGDAYEHYDADTGISEPRIGAYLYINGVEVMNGTADGVTSLGVASTYHGLSPEILKGDGLEGYLAINYWDLCMRAYFDELYIFDEALTAGQVATLWSRGDATVETVKPEDAAPETGAPVDTNAIDVIGTPDMMLGWWSDWSKGFELAEGQTLTMKLNNYTQGPNNWNNFLAVLCNVQTPGHSAPTDVEGYAEYAVIRADNYGWGANYLGNVYNEDGTVASSAGVMTCSWTDWAAWLEVMKDAEVELVWTRTNGTVSCAMTFTGADGTVMTCSGDVLADMGDQPLFIFITAEMAYVEILSVE